MQQFLWAFDEFTPEAKLWITKAKNFFEATEQRSEKIRHSFQQVDVLLITLGLSEVWVDTILSEPMWRTIPSRLYEQGRRVCRVDRVEETVRAFHQFDRLLDTYLPGRRVIFTLSPIPLVATFRNQSPITANAVSKAILRSALDQFLSDDSISSKPRYHYFPSYELVLNLFERPFPPDNRHVRTGVAATILDLFSALYTDLPVSGQAPDPPVVEPLEDRVRELERQLGEKEQVIQELAREADHRLKVINRLAASGAGEGDDRRREPSRRA